MVRIDAVERGMALVGWKSRSSSGGWDNRRRAGIASRALRVEGLEDRNLLSVSIESDAEAIFLSQVGSVVRSADELTGIEIASTRVAAAASTSASLVEQFEPGVHEAPASHGAINPAVSVGFDETAAGPTPAGAAARANLTPFKPSGWSDKIVVSTSTGTHSSNPLAPDDTLYVDWAAINNGRAATSATFYVALFVDGKLRNTWYVEPPLDRNYYVYVEDYAIGMLSVGKHSITIKLDTTKAVAESNESDNAYTKTITVSRPNLTPFAPKGWSDKIVVSSTTGTHSSNKLHSNSPLYVDWAVINSGAPPVKERFSAQLYVDGQLRNTWYTDPPLYSKDKAYVADYAIGTLNPGKHRIQIRVDTTGAVSESMERDNVFTKTITVYAPVMKPNLTPYQPSGWSNKIVISTSARSNTDAENFLTTDTLYVDWAAINSGNTATAKAFISQLYVDGKLARTFTTPASLAPNNYAYAEDIAIGPLSAGRHTIQIRLDTGKAVGELNENDNTNTRSINVTSGVSVRFVVNYSDSAGEGFYDPQRGAARRAAFEYALGIWSNSLAKAYEGETITISASMDSMGGNANSAVLGSAGPNYVRWNFGGNAMSNTVYGDALANHLAGRDLSPGSPEIVAQFNSDVDNQTVLGSTDWYYGFDANPRGDIDFVTVVLHEIGHGLNFVDSIDSSTGGWSIAGYPGIYDRFLENGSGTRLTAMDNAGRRSAIVSNNLYWGGSQGRGGNGGARPKMYAPNPYERGSSVSHTDETVHQNDLMSPRYSSADHTPGSIDLGILADMGWNVRTGSTSAVVFGAGTAPSGPAGMAPFGPRIQDHFEITASFADNPSFAVNAEVARRIRNRAAEDWQRAAAVDWVVFDRGIQSPSFLPGDNRASMFFRPDQPPFDSLESTRFGQSRADLAYASAVARDKISSNRPSPPWRDGVWDRSVENPSRLRTRLLHKAFDELWEQNVLGAPRDGDTPFTAFDLALADNLA